MRASCCSRKPCPPAPRASSICTATATRSPGCSLASSPLRSATRSRSAAPAPAGAEGRVKPVGGESGGGRGGGGGQVAFVVHRGRRMGGFAGRLAVFEKADDPALLPAEIVHVDAGPLGDLPPQQRSERFDPC